MADHLEQKEMPGWGVLDSTEFSARAQLTVQLTPTLPLFQYLYEAGVNAPTFADSNKRSAGVDLPSLFLKRALTDWRGIWLLLTTGYSSQAGTLAASLWENALASIALICEPNTDDTVLKTTQGELPWTARSLAQKAARHLQQRAQTRGEDFPDLEVEANWRVLYGVYGWL